MNFFKIVITALIVTLTIALTIALTPPPTPEEVAWDAFKKEAYETCANLSSFELRHYSMPGKSLPENQRNCYIHILRKKRKELNKR